MATKRRGLKLHSIIEKLSEQCERKSPVPDEDEDVSSEVSNVKRKQRKGKDVKKVYKEASSRSDSDEFSDDEIDVENVENERVNSSNLIKEVVWKTDSGATASLPRAYSCIRTGKRNASKKQTLKEQQKPESKSLKNKTKKPTKRKSGKLKVLNKSKKVNKPSDSGSENDLAIDIDAFVNHAPVMADVDKAACPFCSVMCEDVTQHIKESHDLECAVVDNSENEGESSAEADEVSTSDLCDDSSSDQDEAMSDSSYVPEDISDSDEDIKPHQKSKSKTKNEQTTRNHAKKKNDENSESELNIDVDNVLNTGSGVRDIDGLCVQACSNCGLIFKTVDELTNHTAECTKKDSNMDKPKFCCGCRGCGIKFNQWQDLRNHLDEKSDCRKCHQCEECGKICLTSSFLKKHKRLHSSERPHKCSICNAAFKEKSYLKKHNVTHTGIKEFKCDFCDKRFSHQRTLKEHRMRHTGERPHKCQHCDASFINSTGLKNHSAKHTGIRPHKCQICGKMFTKSYGLKMHSLSHSKDKPFVCEVCGKGFKRPDHFKQHMIIHSDSKPFKCDICHRTFNQKVCLRKHLPCKEHEKQEKKLQSTLAKENRTKNNVKGAKKPTRKRKSVADTDRAEVSQEAGENQKAEGADVLESADVSNDVSLLSSISACPSEGSSSTSCFAPPSFVRSTAKLVDSEYYTEHQSTHTDYTQGRDFSTTQQLSDRTVSSTMNSFLSLPHTIFNVEDPLSLDTLPPLSSRDTHALSGRPLSHDSATDLGSMLLSTVERDLNSIVADSSSFFGND